MTWTYSDPSLPKDGVRFLIGDTNSADPQLSDDEITFLLNSNSGDTYLAAISGVRRLVLKYARRANKSTGNLSLQSASISKQYKDTLAVLITEANRHTAVKPYSAGLYVEDMEENADDDTIAQPSFTVGGDDISDETFTGTVPGQP